MKLLPLVGLVSLVLIAPRLLVTARLNERERRQAVSRFDRNLNDANEKKKNDQQQQRPWQKQPQQRLLLTKHLEAGTAISVDINSPAKNCELFGTPGGDVSVILEGTAKIGAEYSEIGGNPNEHTTAIVYIVPSSTKDLGDEDDRSRRLSGSSESSDSESSDGESPDDESPDDESPRGMLASVKRLMFNPPPDANAKEIGFVAFGSTSEVSTTELVPAVNANNHDGLNDLLVLANKLKRDGSGGAAADYAAALSTACDLVAKSTSWNNVVVLLSDSNGGTAAMGTPGEDGVATTATPLLPMSCEARFETFAIGPDASCSDDDPNGLKSIAIQTGGTCTEVPDHGMLVDTVSSTLSTQLEAVNVLISSSPHEQDDVAYSPRLPLKGPASTSFRANLILSPGEHEICVMAIGKDLGGRASTPPLCMSSVVAEIGTDDSEGVLSGDEGQTHTVKARILVPHLRRCTLKGMAVEFIVRSGPNVNAEGRGIGIADEHGLATFTYPVKQGMEGVGTDIIDACFVASGIAKECSESRHNWSPASLSISDAFSVLDQVVPTAADKCPGLVCDGAENRCDAGKVFACFIPEDNRPENMRTVCMVAADILLANISTDVKGKYGCGPCNCDASNPCDDYCEENSVMVCRKGVVGGDAIEEETRCIPIPDMVNAATPYFSLFPNDYCGKCLSV